MLDILKRHGIRIKVIETGLVEIWENGAKQEYWLGELEDGDLRQLRACILGEIHSLAMHRGQLCNSLGRINREVDRRTNERACVG